MLNCVYQGLDPSSCIHVPGHNHESRKVRPKALHAFTIRQADTLLVAWAIVDLTWRGVCAYAWKIPIMVRRSGNPCLVCMCDMKWIGWTITLFKQLYHTLRQGVTRWVVGHVVANRKTPSPIHCMMWQTSLWDPHDSFIHYLVPAHKLTAKIATYPKPTLSIPPWRELVTMPFTSPNALKYRWVIGRMYLKHWFGTNDKKNIRFGVHHQKRIKWSNLLFLLNAYFSKH